MCVTQFDCLFQIENHHLWHGLKGEHYSPSTTDMQGLVVGKVEKHTVEQK